MPFGQKIREEWKQADLWRATVFQELLICVEESETDDRAVPIGNVRWIENERIVIAAEVRYRSDAAFIDEDVEGVLH
jgi:hypothetical protein